MLFCEITQHHMLQIPHQTCSPQCGLSEPWVMAQTSSRNAMVTALTPRASVLCGCYTHRRKYSRCTTCPAGQRSRLRRVPDNLLHQCTLLFTSTQAWPPQGIFGRQLCRQPKGTLRPLLCASWGKCRVSTRCQELGRGWGRQGEHTQSSPAALSRPSAG